MSPGKEAFKSIVSGNTNISVRRDEYGSFAVYERLPSGLILEAHPFARRLRGSGEPVIDIDARDCDPKVPGEAPPWAKMLVKSAENEKISVHIYFEPLANLKARRPDIDPKRVIKAVRTGLEIFRAYSMAGDDLTFKDYRDTVEDFWGPDYSLDIHLLKEYETLEREIARYKLLRDVTELAF